jgi:hypothetical protein
MILVFITLGIHVNSINCHHNMYLSKKIIIVDVGLIFQFLNLKQHCVYI